MAQTKVNKTAVRIFTGLHGAVYKLSGGRIAGSQGGRIIVLGTTGRKTGKRRERPLISGDHPDGWVVVASFSGHDQHPAWYLNLQANPSATVQIGSDKHDVTARDTEGDERKELWDQMVGLYADYDEYQKVTEREIPVVVLERQAS
jgi:deazaflavin-dependent oxidoreductase (nitroreductase family)